MLGRRPRIVYRKCLVSVGLSRLSCLRTRFPKSKLLTGRPVSAACANTPLGAIVVVPESRAGTPVAQQLADTYATGRPFLFGSPHPVLNLQLPEETTPPPLSPPPSYSVAVQPHYAQRTADIYDEIAPFRRYWFIETLF